MALFGRKKNSRGKGGLRLFFATDVHGSDRCFKKFVNAGRFYGVDAIILGGDITGKTLVPIERTADGYRAKYSDREYVRMTEAERAELEEIIHANGQYPVVGERDELLALEDEELRDVAFKKAVVAGIERWMSIAEERLAGTGIRCFVTPGNDDFFEIDAPLQASDVVEFVEGRRVRVDDDHEMITTGFANRTPWETPRELEEPDFRALLDRMYADVEDPGGLIVVAHPPPYDTEIDQAPAIDSDFNVRMEGGNPAMMPVGSTAVRSFIEERQPLLSLHGHVHDSAGAVRIGRTLCINPGSDYGTGTLMGAIVSLDADAVQSHQLIMG